MASSAAPLQMYAEAFVSGRQIKACGLCGRILRGANPGDFKTMTDDPARRIVMLLGPNGLEKLLGKSGQEMLLTIGYTPEYIRDKLQQNTQFKLLVFVADNIAEPATWQNVISVAGKAYPFAESGLRSNLHKLQTTNFEDIERRAGYNFATVDKQGPLDSRFMTYERYMESDQGLVATRAFLYHVVSLRELFRGDGFTYRPDGTKGLQEYIAANKTLNSLDDYALLELPRVCIDRDGVA